MIFLLFKVTILEDFSCEGDVKVAGWGTQVEPIDPYSNDEIGRIIKLKSSVGWVVDIVDEILSYHHTLCEDRYWVLDE